MRKNVTESVSVFLLELIFSEDLSWIEYQKYQYFILHIAIVSIASILFLSILTVMLQ